MKIELTDFIFKPIGFKHQFENDEVREEFLSAKFQTTVLFCPSCNGERFLQQSITRILSTLL